MPKARASLRVFFLSLWLIPHGAVASDISYKKLRSVSEENCAVEVRRLALGHGSVVQPIYQNDMMIFLSVDDNQLYPHKAPRSFKSFKCHWRKKLTPKK